MCITQQGLCEIVSAHYTQRALHYSALNTTKLQRWQTQNPSGILSRYYKAIGLHKDEYERRNAPHRSLQHQVYRGFVGSCLLNIQLHHIEYSTPPYLTRALLARASLLQAIAIITALLAAISARFAQPQLTTSAPSLQAYVIVTAQQVTPATFLAPSILARIPCDLALHLSIAARFAWHPAWAATRDDLTLALYASAARVASFVFVAHLPDVTTWNVEAHASADVTAYALESATAAVAALTALLRHA